MITFKRFLTESFDGTHVEGGGLYTNPLKSHGRNPPKGKILAAFTDKDGYTIRIYGGTRPLESGMGRRGRIAITNPAGKSVRAGFFMGWTEKEFHLTSKEYNKLSWEEKAALEVKLQASKWGLRHGFESHSERP